MVGRTKADRRRRLTQSLRMEICRVTAAHPMSGPPLQEATKTSSIPRVPVGGVEEGLGKVGEPPDACRGVLFDSVSMTDSCCNDEQSDRGGSEPEVGADGVLYMPGW